MFDLNQRMFIFANSLQTLKMEFFTYFILIFSMLASFECLLAVRLKFLPPGTGELLHFGCSTSVINCTTSTCSLPQQLQNCTNAVAETAVSLRCSDNPNLTKSLPATINSGNKMITTHFGFVNLQTGKRDSLNFVRSSKIFLTSIIN